MVLYFSHEYPVFASSAKSGVDEAKIEDAREDVCGVVLPEEIARPLIEALAKTLEQGKSNE